jgi:hypothetical protein
VLDFNDVGVPSRQDCADHAYSSAKRAWEEQAVKADAANALYMERTYKPAMLKLQAEEEAAAAASSSSSSPAAVTTSAAAGDNVTSSSTSKDIVKEQFEKRRAKIEQDKIKHWKEPSISSSLVVSFGGWTLALAIFGQVIAAVLSFVPVLILNDLVSYFEWVDAGLSPESYQALVPSPWIGVAGLGLVPIIVSLLQTRSNAVMAHCGVFVRTAVSTMLYRKALNVSAAGRAKTSTGQVVNMMSNGTFFISKLYSTTEYLYG